MGIFKTVRKSTIRFLSQKCKSLDLIYLDWDDNADITKVPEQNLAGIHGFAVSNDGKLHDFVFGVTVQTMNDPNLFMMTDIVDVFYSAFLPEKSFDVLDDSGVKIATASFREGAAVHPVNRIENRVTMSIQASFVVNLTE